VDSALTLLAAFNTTAFLLCVGYLVYVLSIMRPFLRAGEVIAGDRNEFEWHYIVPCLNEQEVIEDTIRTAVASFPEASFWVVDDGSDDDTPRILGGLQAEFPNVHLVSRTLPEARLGKGPALNAAWQRIDLAVQSGADRERIVVGVLDADARLQRSCPDIICGESGFGDPTVAAVQIRVRVTCDVDAVAGDNVASLSSRFARGSSGGAGRDPLLVCLQDLEFNGPIAAMQALRRKTSSVGLGGNGQFARLSALDRVALEYGTPWHGALLEDFELGLHILLAGLRTEYCGDTFVAQAGLTRLRPLIRQRSRWAQGGMQCWKYLWQVLSSPRVPLSGALEIAYYLLVPWTQLVGSIVFPTAIALDLYYARGSAGGPAEWWRAGAWGIVPLALIFGAFPNLVWGPLYRSRCGSQVGRRRSIVLGLANIAYGYALQVAVWWAFIRLVRGRSDWKKTARTVPAAKHRQSRQSLKGRVSV
jgi:1,2-diacylglycerol 3-beta-glucosyltransferase